MKSDVSFIWENIHAQVQSPRSKFAVVNIFDKVVSEHRTKKAAERARIKSNKPAFIVALNKD